nr:beta-1,3-galactosyltransferase 5-like isoform X2 [Vanessa tameamea]
MARDVHQQWDDDGYSEKDSDDSPILSYRYDKHRRYVPLARDIKFERERRWAVTAVAKCSLFSTAMILFCVLLYIPVYNRANDQLPKVAVAGWSVHTNRDTKIYVQPDNVTTVHEPKDICPKSSRKSKNSLFLLIVVCSSTTNFAQRIAIRETWGSYDNYIRTAKIFESVRAKYKYYNYTYDLYEERKVNLSVNIVDRKKREIAGFGRFLPELAKALQSNLIDVDNVTPEKRFEDEKEQEMLPEFDMNKELNEPEEDLNVDYDYESNIMKIPPKGYEESPDLDKVLTLLKKSKEFPKSEIMERESGNTDVDFKLVFLLGLPSQDNDTEIQEKIDEEVDKYGDVIQEGFIDSYNNLTLKSIMMLKWVTNNCNQSARYILKTDDDMYVNVPNLIENLRNRSKVHDSTKGQEKEYLLIGDLICGARPVQDVGSKWYSPRYMYGGRVYPRYLSGTGYALSAPAARALYEAALRTSYFHLEDIYITGMCAVRARPRLVPRDEPGFSYSAVGNSACVAHSHLTAHRVRPARMRLVARGLRDARHVDR